MFTQAPFLPPRDAVARRFDPQASVVELVSVATPVRDGGLTRQLSFYGELFVVRFTRLRHAFAVSHADLAEAIGISLGCLSQLSMGERVILDDPAACRRLARLEEVAQRLEGAECNAALRRQVFRAVAHQMNTTVVRETTVVASRIREVDGRAVRLTLVATASQSVG